MTASEPSKENTQVWINPNETDDFVLPEIKDDVVNSSDTWSSAKIDGKFTELSNEIVLIKQRIDALAKEAQ